MGRESDNSEHEVMKLDLAKHRLEIDGVAVGAMIGQLAAPSEASAHWSGSWPYPGKTPSAGSNGASKRLASWPPALAKSAVAARWNRQF